jgi:pyruvate carboxylase
VGDHTPIGNENSPFRFRRVQDRRLHHHQYMATITMNQFPSLKTLRKRTYDASTTSTVVTSHEDSRLSSTNQGNPLQT